MTGATFVKYVVCNRPLDVETNTYCEFDGDVQQTGYGWWVCPSCGGRRWAR